jgi:hypothetical protein
MALLIPTAALGAVEHPLIGSFGSASQPAFSEAQGMAVDQATGDLLVIDRAAQTLSRYHADGTPADFSARGTNVISGLTLVSGRARNPGEVQVAVDNSAGSTNGDIYVAERGLGVVDIYDDNGKSLGKLTEYNEGSFKAFGVTCGVAVDPTGNVYVDNFAGNIHKYAPAANPPVNADSSANFPFSRNCTLAAGAAATNGFIFPTHFNGGLWKLDSTNGEQKYEVDPGPVATETVDPSTGLLYAAIGNEVREYDVSGATEAKALIPIAPGGEQVTGLAVDAASGDIYVARKGNPHIEVWGPAVELPEAVTEPASVIGDTVTLHGAVSAAGGPPATCVFQYASIEAEGFQSASSLPCSPAGPFTGGSPVAVSAVISGLPEGAYRFRLLASNGNGSKAGAALIFDTFERLSGLPDGRAYELVSPPEKAGGEVIPPEPHGNLDGSCSDCLPGENDPSQPMQSAPDGQSVLYFGEPFTAGLASGTDEYLAPRSPEGWGTESLSSPVTIGSYQGFSADLTRAVLHQEEIPLSPQAPTLGGKAFPNLYLVQGGVLQPLVTTEPPNRGLLFVIRFAGANAGTSSVPAFEHVVFSANDALTPPVAGVAPAAPEAHAFGGSCTTLGASCDLYEWAGGRLRLVNVLPGNTSGASGAVIGSGQLLGPEQSPDVDHAISADGSRVFWSSEETGQLYVRIDGNRTLEVPGPGSCKQSVERQERVCFLTASADGSRVLLSDGQVYAINEASSAYEQTADLTNGSGGFQGILGASDDLSRVYFTDTAVLTGGEQNANGEHAETGINLYAWHEGAVRFIGLLSPAIPGDGAFSFGYGAWTASRPFRTAQVTPDGSYLAFMSTAPLTGYDNTLNGGVCKTPGDTPVCFEVFEYSAVSNSLACASCNPTGQRPLGASNLSLLAAGNDEGPPFRQPANLSPDGKGRLFFESQDVLSPDDTNGHIQDVYEWEPDGLGSCKRAAGCVYLISSGHSPNDSMFMDSSATGSDAFFMTREKLLPADENDQLDLYDARVGGGITSPPETQPCGGEACRGPLSTPPELPAPASSIFNGPGNFALTLTTAPVQKPRQLTRAQKLTLALRACAKKPKRKRPACRAQARKRYGKAKSSSKSHKRGR